MVATLLTSVVSAIEHTDGTLRKLTFSEPKQVLKETAETISRMLVKPVIDKGMFGGRAKLPRYSVAAKQVLHKLHVLMGKGTMTIYSCTLCLGIIRHMIRSL